MKWIAIWVLVISFVSANAAEMDLHQAVDAAYKNSPAIQRSQSAAEETSWKRVEAFSTYLPSISAGITYLTNYKYAITDIAFNGPIISVPQILPTSNAWVQVNYNLFDGLASTNRYLASRAFERAGSKEAEWVQFQVAREVTLQFYKTIAAQLLQQVAEQNLKTLEDHLKEVTLFKKSGISTNFDVLRVDVQVSEARSEIMNTKDNIEIARGHLAEILGQEEAVVPKGDMPMLDKKLVDKLQENISQRADLEAAGEKLTAFEDLDSASSRHWVPRVSLAGQYQFYNNRNDSFTDFSNYRNAYQLGINLTWNFFDGFASTAKAQQSLEEKVQTEKSVRIAQLKAKQDLGFWKRKYVYFCTVFQSRLNDIDKSKESVRLAKEGQRVGARTNTDLLDAEAELYRAQAGAVNAQVGSIEAIINLELATGQKLSDLN